MQLFVNNLTNVDFSYLHPSRGLLGETWLASIVLSGALDQQSMVCDFGIVKQVVRQWLDDNIDHKLVVAGKYSGLQSRNKDQQIEIDWQLKSGGSINSSGPAEAIAILDVPEISPPEVAQWCEEQLKTLLPHTIEKLELIFRPEQIDGAFYHYSHGLKKHDGNCQRIAHGHRSGIEIYRNGGRDRELEQQWAKRWQDIYIGTREDLLPNSMLESGQACSFAYQTSQGDFSLTLPNASCYLIDTDTTVECLAAHIAEQLKQQYTGDNFVVRAFEGLGKGAIVSL